MHGIIQNHKHAYKRRVTVTPIVHSYHEPGETPYEKFTCPVCNAVGNAKIAIPQDIEQCPLCGVSLNWTRQPEVGDEIIITESVEWEPSLTIGTKATIQKIHNDSYEIQTEVTHYVCGIPKDTFSILEEVE